VLFAVVADEVKAPSSQTAKATDEGQLHCRGRQIPRQSAPLDAQA